MLRYNMAVVTKDNRFKREVQKVSAATGAAAEFLGDLAAYESAKPTNLFICDARNGEPPKPALGKVPDTAGLMYVVPDGALLDKLHLFKDKRTASLMCHDTGFDEDEFIASATKALRGDVFGLNKYFPWGVTTFSMVVKNYAEKSRAIDVLMRYAKLAGVRGPVRERLQIVCDELMMNALYHSQVDAEGKELYRNRTLKELAQLPEVAPIQVQYGCSGRYFGISVRDGGGSLTRDRALEYLQRARAGAAHIENKSTGAGLGLVSILRSVSKLIFNLDPGYSTEVVALFDLEQFAQGKVGARSLHMFSQTAPPESEDADEGSATAGDGKATAASSGPGHLGKWIAAALLLAVVTAMGTAVVMKRGGTAAAAHSAPALVIEADPPGAQITVGDTVVAAGQEVPLSGPETVVRVEMTGHQPWTRSFKAADVNGRVRLVVALKPNP